MIGFRHSALVGFLELPQQAWRHHVEWESLRAVFKVDSELLATFDPHQGAVVERFVSGKRFSASNSPWLTAFASKYLPLKSYWLAIFILFSELQLRVDL